MIEKTKYIKQIFTWLVILIASIALIFTGLGINSNQNNKSKDTIKIGNFTFTKNEVSILVNNILKKKYIKENNTDCLEKKITKIIINNIKFNSYQEQNKIITTEKEIIDIILSEKKFQKNGVFSKNLYKSFLERKKYTDIEFQKNIKINSIKTQIKNGLYNSNLKRIEFNQKNNKVINFQFKKIKHEKFTKKQSTNNQKILNFYHENENKFISNEIIKIEYIDLSIKNIIKNITTTEKKINKYYKKNKYIYLKTKLTKIKHAYIQKNNIQALSNLNKKNTLEIENTFKNEINNFKTIWIGKDEINKKLENIILYSIKNPHENKLIKSKDGIHLIKLVKIYNNKKYIKEKIKLDIENKYKKEKAKKSIDKQSTKISNMVFEEEFSIEKSSKICNIETKISKYFSKTGGFGILSLPIVIKSAFDKNIITNKRNSNSIKINNHRFLFLRVIEHKSPLKTSFKENISKIEKYMTLIELESEIFKIYTKKLDIITNKNQKLPSTWIVTNYYSKYSKNNNISKKMKMEILKQTTAPAIKIIKNKNNYFAMLINKIEYIKTNDTDVYNTNTKEIYNIYKKTNVK
ncbi:MAG: SurA N-terminal domain-containing protein [Enterobacteriaceae bacterium]|nr:SurA N-terminal domain-containing protein [Enterobacteriaceae bacterium]